MVGITLRPTFAQQQSGDTTILQRANEPEPYANLL
jgi:hypothetical protein